ncbi:MAG TPA: transposase family protein [Armatimonadota bacterium]|nr:transposase family protein [Armatimonadota bacterium]
MSFRAKRELLVQVAPRYREASHKQRSVMLDEFVAATGYARKYAIRLLTGPVVSAVAPIRRPRTPHYGAAVRDALAIAWQASNGICAKRLVPFLPELVPTLERHGHLVLEESVRGRLLALSPATADRLLRPLRQPRGLGTTKPGRLLKHQIPVRTFAEWTDVRPGFFEADLVAHCGGSAEGAYLYSLVLTDVATGWTECLPLLHRTQHAVLQGLTRVRQLLPFPLLGFDTDNGGEFLNAELFAYCEQEEITFTRGRPYTSNDQCFVEQKNGSIVRQLVGYDRFEGERAYRQLAELYRAVRLYVNVFQPSMKLRTKQRLGGRVHRTYDAAQTPYQRLLAADVLGVAPRQRLETIVQALDPVRLLRQLEILQDALWRHAVAVRRPVSPPVTDTADITAVRFNAGACGLDPDAGAAAGTGLATGARPRRRYRRTPKATGPRTYRTRPDPFEAAWSEVCGWLTAQPERTATSVFHDLQLRYPGQYPDAQLRTLQRRVKEWRARIVLTFDEQWLSEELLIGRTLPPPLQTLVEPASVEVSFKRTS